MAESWIDHIDRQRCIADEVMRERDRQDELFGEQWEMPLVADSRDHDFYEANADSLKRRNGKTARDGMSMFLEEVYEAGAESDPQKMRAELIQALAVGMRMVEKIDREAGK